MLRPGILLRASVLLLALLFSGCSSSGDSMDTPPSGAPAGWTKDDCDTREPGFGAKVSPSEIFRRAGNESAERLASRVVEAVGDSLGSKVEPTPLEGENDPHSWQTGQGFVTVYWAEDPAAWTVDHTTTMVQSGEQDPTARNASAHAVLGAVGVDVAPLGWTEGPNTLLAQRDVADSSLPVLRVEDQEMSAEQVQVVRRQMHLDPDYELPQTSFLGEEEAGRIAKAFADCQGEGHEATSIQMRVVGSILSYRVDFEPASGWQECGHQAGRLHVALDAVTGTVLSADLACTQAS